MKKAWMTTIALSAFAWTSSAWALSAQVDESQVEAVGVSEAGEGMDGTATVVGAKLFHTPATEAVEGVKRGLVLSAEWIGEWSGTALNAHCRRVGEGAYRAIAFEDRYRQLSVMIPADLLVTGTLEYYIDSVESDGRTVARFASAEHPHVVRVLPNPRIMREKARLDGHNGKRHKFGASFMHYDMGASNADVGRSDDSFNTLEIAYEYRFLMDAIYSIRAGFTMIGGYLGSQTPFGGEPGAYMGTMTTTWEFEDVFGIEPTAMIGASHEGFVIGSGLTLRVGAVRGTHFDIGYSYVGDLGHRFVTDFTLKSIPYTIIGLRGELTSWPDRLDWAVIPSFLLGFRIPGGVELGGRIGYGIRTDNEAGWISWGVQASLDF